MPGKAVNVLNEQYRTDDVIVHDDINFKDLLLSDSILKGLEDNGFKKPSPIQRKAIPLGRCGFDLIVQAKSGTGKTCVFTVIALETIKPELTKLQVLILSPTREISVQIKDVISNIGKGLENLKVEAFIGGMPLENDKKNLNKCQIAVGAPGRVKHLISNGLMKVDAVRLFVIDEADKLMEDNFRKDISFIYLKLPEVKQMIAASATFPPSLEEFVASYMTNPMRVSPGKDVFLIGIRQFVSIVPSHLSVFIQIKNKMAELLRILTVVPFKQCLIFSNYQSRAESICNELNKEGWPAIYISGSQSQTDRLKAMTSLKKFRCRILLSTDLSSRGIDAENVNLIINLDVPYDGATYMHRIGRAGRYGTYGLAITILQDGPEYEQFRKMLYEIGGRDFHVSLFPKEKFAFNIWKSKDEDFEKIYSIEGEYKYLRVKERGREEKLNNREVEEEKVKTSAVEKVCLGGLVRPVKPEIINFEDLLKLESDFKMEPKEVNNEEEDFRYEEFPTELLSATTYVENDGWRKFKELILKKKDEIEEDNKETKHDFDNDYDGSYKDLKWNKNVTKSPKNKKGSFFERNEQRDINVKQLQKNLKELRCGNDYNDSRPSNKNEEESSSEKEIEKESEEEQETEEESEEEQGTEEESEDDQSETESDSSTEEFHRNSSHIKKWYSIWYAQELAIRQYVYYLKYIQYWNFVGNNR